MRVPHLTPRYCGRVKRLELQPEQTKAVARCTAALCREDLPTLQDAEASMPPTAIYWFRRVPHQNLWVWFTFDEATVFLVSLTSNPPVPLEPEAR
jgi:hypothetical protein